jgi:hypothetical protein
MAASVTDHAAIILFDFSAQYCVGAVAGAIKG